MNNRLLIEREGRGMLGNIDLRSWQYGHYLALKNKTFSGHDYFYDGSGPYGKIATNKEPIRSLEFTSIVLCDIIMSLIPPYVKDVHIRI